MFYLHKKTNAHVIKYSNKYARNHLLPHSPSFLPYSPISVINVLGKKYLFRVWILWFRKPRIRLDMIHWFLYRKLQEWTYDKLMMWYKRCHLWRMPYVSCRMLDIWHMWFAEVSPMQSYSRSYPDLSFVMGPVTATKREGRKEVYLCVQTEFRNYYSQKYQ